MKLIKSKGKHCAIKYDRVSRWHQNMHFSQAFNHGLFDLKQEMAGESITLVCISSSSSQVKVVVLVHSL